MIVNTLLPASRGWGEVNPTVVTVLTVWKTASRRPKPKKR
jgi:hypothetical protein